VRYIISSDRNQTVTSPKMAEWMDENFWKLRLSLNLDMARSRRRNGKWEFSA
jgi:hypothetical protein